MEKPKVLDRVGGFQPTRNHRQQMGLLTGPAGPYNKSIYIYIYIYEGSFTSYHRQKEKKKKKNLLPQINSHST